MILEPSTATIAETPDVEPHRLARELADRLRDGGEICDLIRRATLDGIWYWDLEKPDEEWMSPEFWQLFGYDPATKRHSPDEWQDIIFPEDRDIALANFERHCADPDHPYDQIVRYRHADGSTVWVRCHGLAIRDESGRPIRMLGVHNDITPLKRAEAELIRRNRSELERKTRLAETADKELMAFAYASSHDLLSPVTTLSMVLRELEMELGGNVSEDARLLMERGQATADRAVAVVEDVLDYVRLIGVDTVDEPVDLDRLVAEVLVDLDAELQSAGAVVETVSLGTIAGSPTQLRLLVENLVSNAIRYRRDEPLRIRVALESGTHRGPVLVVEDNGAGIPVERQEQIFDLFARFRSGRTEPGSGLGLALCRRVCANHGATISVESEPDVGSRFLISLPEGVEV